MKEHLCYSRNNIEVIYDTTDSHAATHFEDTPQLKSAVITALQATDITGSSMFFEHDLKRIIGTTDLVETTEKDKIIYAKRKNRGDVYTRFTTSQTPRDCSTVVLCLEKRHDSKYELSSAWIGSVGPSFPGSEDETPESKPYWDKHALVMGRQEIQEETETSECPW